MSIVRQEGKDTIIFATKEDHASPSTITLPEPEPSPGLLLPNGEINWNCPCLGGMATGPCGLEFRDAFSCFHYSSAEPKGSDCYEAFKTMQSCMSEYPALYGNKDTDMDDLDMDEAEALDSKKSQDRKDLEPKESSQDRITQIKASSNEAQVERVGDK
ncbi:mitochondrial intermembrane space import and assembly protein 40-B [Chelonus insularis]|uniref:mitochondrial intermembrane space import and assembly protein 40-B n=1 Tax=Chelonus insularis TaxID=460826 RepID=UPI001589619E|nr:mitochondrial intermembrane space import and assembly protein 40-B [Chelonus insularis]